MTELMAMGRKWSGEALFAPRREDDMVRTLAARLTTITRHDVAGTEVARIRSEVQLDGDTMTEICDDTADLAGCHRAAVAFTSELAAARLRMIAGVARRWCHDCLSH
jgi:hypothetical protein